MYAAEVQYAEQQVTNAAPTTCAAPDVDSEGFDAILGWSTSSSTSDVDSEVFDEQVVQYVAARQHVTYAAPTADAAPTAAQQLTPHPTAAQVQHAAQQQVTYADPKTAAALTDLDRIEGPFRPLVQHAAQQQVTYADLKTAASLTDLDRIEGPIRHEVSVWTSMAEEQVVQYALRGSGSSGGPARSSAAVVRRSAAGDLSARG